MGTGGKYVNYAILADIHGDRKRLKQVLQAISTRQADHVFCLGDIFECKIGKKEVDAFRFAFLDQVVDHDPKLVKRLRYMSSIIGNQEERIRQLIPPGETDEEMRFFLTLPPAIELEHARLEHGHRFVDERDWAPYPRRMTKRFLFFGHTHESGLYRLRLIGKHWKPEKQPIEFGVPYRLEPDKHWAINVGAVVNREPEWLLYEEESHTVTFFRESAPIDKHT